MALPMIQKSTEQADWSEILGHEIEAHLPPGTGLVGAILIYESFMDEKLGYILEESPSLTPLVQQALDEIASGQTTVVHSAEELEEHLRGEGQSD